MTEETNEKFDIIAAHDAEMPMRAAIAEMTALGLKIDTKRQGVYVEMEKSILTGADKIGKLPCFYALKFGSLEDRKSALGTICGIADIDTSILREDNFSLIGGSVSNPSKDLQRFLIRMRMEDSLRRRLGLRVPKNPLERLALAAVLAAMKDSLETPLFWREKRLIEERFLTSRYTGANRDIIEKVEKYAGAISGAKLDAIDPSNSGALHQKGFQRMAARTVVRLSSEVAEMIRHADSWTEPVTQNVQISNSNLTPPAAPARHNL